MSRVTIREVQAGGGKLQIADVHYCKPPTTEEARKLGAVHGTVWKCDKCGATRQLAGWHDQRSNEGGWIWR